MLEGVRILDLTHRLAGPFATMILAQMGAEVIKVESPEGDLVRVSGADFQPGVSEFFATFNHSKRFVGINLRHERGREAFLRLAKVSDAVVDNFRPGVLDRLGLSLRTLREVNPGLVSVSLSGFGPDGPDRDRPALDLAIQGISGLMGLTGEPDGPPVPCGIPISDLGTGLYGAIALLAGILGRDRGHQAGTAQLSMLQAQLHLMSFNVMSYLNGGEPPKRLGAETLISCPYGVFATADGYMNICCRGEDYWQAFLQRMNLTHLADDPRFRDNPARLAHRREINAIFAEALKTRTTAEWMEIFDGLIVGPINTVPEAFANPHVQATEGVSDVAAAGEPTLRIVTNPVQWHGETTEAWIPRRIGCDTVRVLTSVAGYDAAQVEEMAQVGAVVVS